MSTSSNTLSLDSAELNPHFTVLWPDTKEFRDLRAPYRQQVQTPDESHTSRSATSQQDALMRHASRVYASSRKEPSALLKALCPTRHVPAVSLTRPIFPPAPGPGPGAYTGIISPPLVTARVPQLSTATPAFATLASSAHAHTSDPSAAAAMYHPELSTAATQPHVPSASISRTQHTRLLSPSKPIPPSPSKMDPYRDIDSMNLPPLPPKVKPHVRGAVFTTAPRLPLPTASVGPAPGAYGMNLSATIGRTRSSRVIGATPAARISCDTKSAALAALHGAQGEDVGRIMAIADRITLHLDDNGRGGKTSGPGPGVYYQPNQPYFSMGAVAGKSGGTDCGAGPSTAVVHGHVFGKARRVTGSGNENSGKIGTGIGNPYEALLLTRARRLREWERDKERKERQERESAAAGEDNEEYGVTHASSASSASFSSSSSSASLSSGSSSRRASTQSLSSHPSNPSALSSSLSDSGSPRPRHRTAAPVRSVADVHALCSQVPVYARAQLHQLLHAAGHDLAGKGDTSSGTVTGSSNADGASATAEKILPSDLEAQKTDGFGFSQNPRIGSARARVRAALAQAKPEARRDALESKRLQREERLKMAKANREVIALAEQLRVEANAQAMGMAGLHSEWEASANAWARTVWMLVFVRRVRDQHLALVAADEEEARRVRAALMIQKCVRLWLRQRLLKRQAKAAHIILRQLRLNVLRRRAKRRKWAAQVLISALNMGAQQRELVNKVHRVRSAAITIQQWWRAQRERRKWQLYGPHLQWEREMTVLHNRYREVEGARTFDRLKKRGLLRGAGMDATAKQQALQNVFIPHVSKELRHAVLKRFWTLQQAQWCLLVREYIHRQRVWRSLYELRRDTFEQKKAKETVENSAFLRTHGHEFPFASAKDSHWLEIPDGNPGVHSERRSSPAHRLRRTRDISPSNALHPRSQSPRQPSRSPRGSPGKGYRSVAGDKRRGGNVNDPNNAITSFTTSMSDSTPSTYNADASTAGEEVDDGLTNPDSFATLSTEVDVRGCFGVCAQEHGLIAELDPDEVYELVKELPPMPRRPYRRVFLPRATLYSLFLQAYEEMTPKPPTQFKQRIKTFMANMLRRQLVLTALNQPALPISTNSNNTGNPNGSSSGNSGTGASAGVGLGLALNVGMGVGGSNPSLLMPIPISSPRGNTQSGLLSPRIGALPSVQSVNSLSNGSGNSGFGSNTSSGQSSHATLPLQRQHTGASSGRDTFFASGAASPGVSSTSGLVPSSSHQEARSGKRSSSSRATKKK